MKMFRIDCVESFGFFYSILSNFSWSTLKFVLCFRKYNSEIQISEF